MRIATLGSGSGKSGETPYDFMRRVGQLLANTGHAVINGAFGGAGMEAPSLGARESGGQAIGYTLANKPGNPHLTQTIDCSQWDEQIRAGIGNVVQPGFGLRLDALMSSD